MYNQLVIKHNHNIKQNKVIVMYSRHYFYETAVRSDCFSFILLLQNDWYMAHFVDSAHWLLEQCIVGKLQHQFYDTDNFFISY